MKVKCLTKFITCPIKLKEIHLNMRSNAVCWFEFQFYGFPLWTSVCFLEKFQLQQQQIQQQQDLLTNLANRLLAAPAAIPVVAPVPAQAVAIRATLDTDVKYSGSTDESIQDWLQLVNRKALAENWGDVDKRRAAISSLFGKALNWQEEIGANIPQWDDWIDGLRRAFEIQLTEVQWQMMVEGRKQLPNEPGSTYALEKLKLCRRRAIPLADAKLIPYLIRGLYRPEMRSVMMGNPPVSVNAGMSLFRISSRNTYRPFKKEYWIRCFAHVINLCVKSTLDVMRVLLQKLRDLVVGIKSSPQWIEKIQRIAKYYEVEDEELDYEEDEKFFLDGGLIPTDLLPILDCPTSYSSTYFFLKRALKIKNAQQELRMYELQEDE
ncbi:Uncharacterized protein APZ42_031149 [Daphnia magna]|uniref:Uncharacterized protein n=1 Tax=Daphnia magna TaxID=35525 RepID=A0A164N3J4_9CRUS|nr:Uncharacterized protein APZ42_031149 [Daphnia magna]